MTAVSVGIDIGGTFTDIGGGFGDARVRSIAAIDRDLADGKVSVAGVLAYGVREVPTLTH